MIQAAKKLEALHRPSMFAVWRCADAKPTERLMLSVIVSQMRTPDEQRFDSIERLADLMGCSVRTAQETKRHLAEKGYLTVTERVGRDGGRSSDLIALGPKYFKAAAALKRPLAVVPPGAESAGGVVQNLRGGGAESAGKCRELNAESLNTKTLRFPEAGKTPRVKPPRGTRQVVADALQVICLPGDWQRYGGMKHLGATARMALEFHELDVIKRWAERVRGDGFAGQVPLGKVLSNLDGFVDFERREAV